MDRHGTRGLFALRTLLGLMLCMTHAAYGAQDSTTLQAPQEKAKTSALKTVLLVQTAGTVNAADEKMASGLYMISAKYSSTLWGRKLGLSASVGHQRQYTYQGAGTQTLAADVMPEGRSWDWVDPRLSATLTEEKFAGFDSATYGLKATIAGLSYASERKSQAGAIGPTFSLTKTWSRTTLINSLDYRYVHHHYRTRNDGGVNSPHVFIVGSTLDYSLGSRWGTALSLSYSQVISYQNVIKGGIGAGLESYYTLSDRMSAALGVSNDTTGFAADGQTRELDFFDPASATFYFNLEFNI